MSVGIVFLREGPGRQQTVSTNVFGSVALPLNSYCTADKVKGQGNVNRDNQTAKNVFYSYYYFPYILRGRNNS